MGINNKKKRMKYEIWEKDFKALMTDQETFYHFFFSSDLFLHVSVIIWRIFYPPILLIIFFIEINLYYMASLIALYLTLLWDETFIIRNVLSYYLLIKVSTC